MMEIRLTLNPREIASQKKHPLPNTSRYSTHILLVLFACTNINHEGKFAGYSFNK